MQKIMLLIAVLMSTASCQLIMKKMYGIKDPEVENEQSIVRKAQKYKLDTSNIVTISKSDYSTSMKGQQIPDCAFFDAEGNYIEYRQSDTSCNAGIFGFIPALTKEGAYNKTGKTTLSAELAKFRTLKGMPLSAMPEADFYVLIYWTVFAGKLNKDHVKIWEDLARENASCRIHVIKVNADLQEYWEKAESINAIR